MCAREQNFLKREGILNREGITSPLGFLPNFSSSYMHVLLQPFHFKASAKCKPLGMAVFLGLLVHT